MLLSNKHKNTSLMATAILIVCLFIFLVIVAYKSATTFAYMEYQESRSAIYYATNAARKLENCNTNINSVNITKCVQETIQSTREHQRAEKDLTAQRKMSEWAFWMFIVTAIVGPLTVAVSAIGIHFLRRTLNATNEMNKIATAAYQLDKRAWMAPLPIVNYKIVRKSEDTFHYQFFVQFKNIGQVPAMQVSVSTSVLEIVQFSKANEENIKVEFEQTDTDHAFNKSSAIFPNGNSGASSVTILKAKKYPDIVFIEFTCKYNDGTSGQLKKTSIVYQIHTKTGEIPLNSTIEQHEILFLEVTASAMVT